MESPEAFFKDLLLEMTRRGASSLHLSVGNAPLMRVFGRLMVAGSEEAILKEEDLEKIIDSFLSPEEKKYLEIQREVLTVQNFSENFRFRVRVFYQQGKISISLTHISEKIRDFDSLGFPDNFKKNLFSSSGLLIITGSVNSGKTSTIASIIEKINQDKKSYIITLERPVEKIFIDKKSIIEQRQVGQDVNSYADGLKHALEEDVDLVFIDEIKTGFDIALPLILELASGNCLVILEMSAENSIRALEKIINTNCKELSRDSLHFILADVLFGVIAQKLIPNRENELSLAMELLLSNFAVKSLIREGNIYQLEGVIQNSGEDGMISMEKSVKNLIKSGEINEEELDYKLRV